MVRTESSTGHSNHSWVLSSAKETGLDSFVCGLLSSHEIKGRESEWHLGKYQHAKDWDGEEKAVY